jgi:hypothetical protein
VRKIGIAAATVAASAPATQACRMPPISYTRYRFPPVIISTQSGCTSGSRDPISRRTLRTFRAAAAAQWRAATAAA